MCQGYYRHEQGYTPDWPGMETFKGRIMHPQTWPDDLKYRDRRVVVIGSGATAATLVPAIADDCAHVTLLQRSLTFFRTGRKKILYEQSVFTDRAFSEPETVKQELLAGGRGVLGPDYDVEKHFM